MQEHHQLALELQLIMGDNINVKQFWSILYQKSMMTSAIDLRWWKIWANEEDFHKTHLIIHREALIGNYMGVILLLPY
ncbi:hypothetical protein CEXT_205461 [Caerostris extrusa]|uniref:Uncharacterized protein n=1 Tax=Caerostris extrusa TaxID=172846 RepID=A0AAV4V0B1_CAEEX|nr:hypothetical protein CEXT_205461 [Caerostris extrusa]